MDAFPHKQSDFPIGHKFLTRFSREFGGRVSGESQHPAVYSTYPLKKSGIVQIVKLREKVGHRYRKNL